MKAFLVAHGEKIALAVVGLIAAWSFFTSFKSLSTTERVSEADKKAIEKIARELKNKKASPRVPSPYGEWLQSNLDGHGIYALTVGLVASPLVYEPPFQGKGGDEPVVVKVAGTMGLPTGLSAKGDRGKITFSWAASTTNEYMKLLKYEVYRREERGPWGATPVYTGEATTFEDKDVRPEIDYAYKVRAAGVKVGESAMTIVIPMVPPLVQQGNIWFTAYAGSAGKVKAMTPSNVDFECSSVFERFGEKYANIVVKRWNSEKDKWIRFKTEPGIKVGNEVIGRRKYGPGRMLVELFDSGYTLKEILDEIRIFKVIVRRLVEDPPGSGKVDWKDVEVEVPTRVQEVILEKKDGSQKVIVPVGRGKTTIQKKQTDKSKKTEDTPDGVEAFKRMFEQNAGVPNVAKRAQAGKTARAVAPSAPAVTLAQARSSIRLTFPAGWVATGDMAALGVGTAWRPILDDGKAAVYKGTVEKSGVVIADRPFSKDDLQRAFGSGKLKTDVARDVKRLATGLMYRDWDFLMDINGLKLQGDAGTRKTKKGKLIGTYTFTAGEGQDRMTVIRYFAMSPGRLFALSFVCGEENLEAQTKVFDEMVSSWTW